jgi:hypothetical protein
MSQRVPASMRTRQSLSDVIEGRLSSPAGGQAGDAADHRGDVAVRMMRPCSTGSS